MSLPDWEEEASAQKSLLSIGRNQIIRRTKQRGPSSVGTENELSESEFSENEDVLEDKKTPLLAGDRMNVVLLLFLYILQGIPLGLAGSIPMILSSRHVSYHDQAFFSLVFWPFSLKLIWAPVVDSVYSKSFGRRKSWLVPTQYLIGFFMLLLSFFSDEILNKSRNIIFVTVAFFLLNFLASIQDIAVDGWALTMLSKKNVGYASTCNSVGQTAGYFIGNVLFLAFESADFCNKYIRNVPQKEGILTLPGYLWFWGIVFVLSTTMVWVMKKETDDAHDHEEGVLAAYGVLGKILKLPSVMKLCVILLTSKATFAAAEAVAGLKLIEYGVHKEQLALLAIPMVPLQVVLPLLISKYSAGPKPMDIFLKSYPFRMLMGIEFALLVWITPKMQSADGTFPVVYYGMVLISYAVHQVALYGMFVSVMGFFARISDPIIGGTYMTLLNTVYNLGGNWPNTLVLSLVDDLTWANCKVDTLHGFPCQKQEQKEACTAGGGSCITDVDGFYVQMVICSVFGLFWFRFFRKRITALQDLPESAWRIRK